MLISSDAQFAFRLRRERIDWKLLASVDVEKVCRDVDFQTLQNNTANVTFCDIRAEVDQSTMDNNFIKLFRLAQLIIEYLIYSQDCLSTALSASEQESLRLSKQVAELEEKLKKEKQRKNYADVNQPYVIVDNGNQCKCSYCPKMFFNQTFLRMHHERRHPAQPLITSADIIPTKLMPNMDIDMETELIAIKERLKLSENLLMKEQAALEDTAAKNHILQKEAEIQQEMEAWKVEQLKTHKLDLQNVKDSFQLELEILKERCKMSESQLQELQEKTVPLMTKPKISPVELVAADNKSTEVMKYPEQDNLEMKELFKQQMLKINNTMQQKLREQDDHWKSKVSQIEDKYDEEIQKLKETEFVHKQGDNQQILHLPDMELTLNRQIKELKKLNILQQHVIDKKRSHSQRKIKKSHSKRQPLLNQDNVTSTQDVHGNASYTDDQSTESSQFVDKPLATSSALIRDNPVIIQGMRDEVSNLLDEKLELFGISKDAYGVKESSLKRKLKTQHIERRKLAKKYRNLSSIREQLQLQVDKMAQLKLMEHKMTSSTPAKARNSIMRILRSVKDKVDLARSRSRSPSHGETLPSKYPSGISGNSRGDTFESGLSKSFHHAPVPSGGIISNDNKDNSITDRESSSEVEMGTSIPMINNAAGVKSLASSLEKQLSFRKDKPPGGINVFPVDQSIEKGTTSTANKAVLKSQLNSKHFTSTPEMPKNKLLRSSHTTAAENMYTAAASSDDDFQLSKLPDLPTKIDAEHSFNFSSWDSENDISEIS